jgi:hypothetical protein
VESEWGEQWNVQSEKWRRDRTFGGEWNIRKWMMDGMMKGKGRELKVASG